MQMRIITTFLIKEISCDNNWKEKNQLIWQQYSSKWHKDAEIYAPQTDKQDSKTTQNFESRINMEH